MERAKLKLWMDYIVRGHVELQLTCKYGTDNTGRAGY